MEGSISLNALFVWCAWVLGVGLIVSGVVYPERGLGAAGMALVVFGSLRCLLRRLAQMQAREAAAFDLGRDAVRTLR